MFQLFHNEWARPYIRKSCILTVVVAVFGILYEQFSHGILSRFMVLAFLVPLFGGVGYYTLSYFTLLGKYRFLPAEKMLNMGTACLTVGSLVKGILNIYGTTNRLIKYYAFAGAALLLIACAAFMLYFINCRRKGISPGNLVGENSSK